MIESIYIGAFSEGCLPDPDYWLDEWADKYRVLSSKSSAEAGRWRTDRTPYLRQIMRELSPNSPTQRIVFMKASQIGGSEVGFNWIGYTIHLSPCPMLFVSPSIDLAEKISKQRIAPMIEESEVLSNKVSPQRERDSGNTMLVKEFTGGLLVLTGANSAVGLRSMPIKRLFCTEISSYPSDVGGEGDPVNLAEKRTQTFARRKIYLESTPTIKDSCRIESEYLQSDQRRYFVPCPFCQEKQWLQFKNLKWDNDDRLDVKYQCEKCSELIPEFKKTWMLENGEWIATNQGTTDTVGFHLSSLYSPVGWKTWNEIVSEFLKAKGDAPLLKTWVNTILGESWAEEYGERVGADALKARAEQYEFECPAEVLAITCGIDVQDNRVAICHWGWARDEESFVLQYQEILGDPSTSALWKQVDEAAFYPFKTKNGTMSSLVTAIDSGGHFTHFVYQYARERKERNVIAVKGSSQKGKTIIGKPSKVDLNLRGQYLKHGALVYPVGTDTAKSLIYGRLKHNTRGAGYIHFSNDLPDSFYQMLTAEKLATKYVRGFPVREWTIKSGQRNESLDCSVYATAALNFLYTKYNRKTFWDQMEKLKNATPKVNAVSLQNNVAQNKMRNMNPKKNFVSGY